MSVLSFTIERRSSSLVAVCLHVYCKNKKMHYFINTELNNSEKFNHSIIFVSCLIKLFLRQYNGIVLIMGSFLSMAVEERSPADDRYDSSSPGT